MGDAYINQHLSVLRTSVLEPRYLSAYLSSPTGQLQVLAKNRQGVKAGLNFDDIRSLRIPEPPKDLQHEFNQRIAVLDKIAVSQKTSLAKLDALVASLQQRAFRGEL